MGDLIHTLQTISSIIMPVIIIPLYKLQNTLTEIKIDIAKLKQYTGVK